MNKEYLSPSEVASILNVCQRTVLRMIQEGKLFAIQVGGKERKRWRILSGELDRYVAREYEKQGKQNED